MKKVRVYIGIVAALFCLTFSLPAGAVDDQGRFVLVIDAGHGGHDTGDVGVISKEKNLTLKFALAFGRLVEQNCPDVKVIYTRKTDKFVELYRRAEIANQAKAIREASAQVEDGGYLLYFVDTISKKETIGIVNDFLKEHSEFTLTMDKLYFPYKKFGGSYYFAVLKKGAND